MRSYSQCVISCPGIGMDRAVRWTESRFQYVSCLINLWCTDWLNIVFYYCCCFNDCLIIIIKIRYYYLSIYYITTIICYFQDNTLGKFWIFPGKYALWIFSFCNSQLTFARCYWKFTFNLKGNLTNPTELIAKHLSIENFCSNWFWSNVKWPAEHVLT